MRNTGSPSSQQEHERAVKTVEIVPRTGWVALQLGDVWEFRDLLWVLTSRDVRIRYKQTLLGAGWAILQPFFAMIVFSVFLGRVAGVSSEGFPYPIFAYSGLLIWLYFAEAIKRAGESLVGNSVLVSRVYFPRLIAPLSGVLSPLVDLAVAYLLLIALMFWYSVPIGWTMLLLPVFTLAGVLTAAAFGIWLAALNVEYRDIRHAIPLLVQLWLFMTPVVYPAGLIGPRLRLLYALNPMAGVVQGFRWCILQRGAGVGGMFVVSLAVIALVLTSGLFYFQRVEKRFADAI